MEDLIAKAIEGYIEKMLPMILEKIMRGLGDINKGPTSQGGIPSGNSDEQQPELDGNGSRKGIKGKDGKENFDAKDENKGNKGQGLGGSPGSQQVDNKEEAQGKGRGLRQEQAKGDDKREQTRQESIST